MTNPAACTRCGVCCQKGGPSLHLSDRPQVLAGHIPLPNLWTLRPGEWVWDNVQESLIRTPQELIRVQSNAGGKTCPFYGGEDGGCGIYPHRPEECRVLACWQPQGLKKMYQQSRLSRADVLADVPALWELIQAHDQHCGVRRMADLHGQGRGNDLQQMLAWDDRLRRHVADHNPGAADYLFFLFGRPLRLLLQAEQQAALRQHQDNTPV